MCKIKMGPESNIHNIDINRTRYIVKVSIESKASVF